MKALNDISLRRVLIIVLRPTKLVDLAAVSSQLLIADQTMI